MPKVKKTESLPMDNLRVRFIEVCDAIMRDNPKVRSVKNIARMLETPYLSLHKVYNYRKHKTSYPSTAQLQALCNVFKTVNPDYLLTGGGGIYRDVETESKITELEKDMAQIKRILKITSSGVRKG